MAIRPLIILSFWLCLLSPGLGEDFNVQFTDSQAIEILVSGTLNKELDLVAEQVDALRNISEHRRKTLLQRFASPSGPAAESAKQNRPPKYADLLPEANRQAFKAIEEVLLPHQLKRWKQIVLQLTHGNEPNRALLLPSVVHQLQIKPEQEEAIKQMFADAEKKIQKMAEEIRKERDEQIHTRVLSTKQRAEFENLFGSPFRRGASGKPRVGIVP